MFAGVPGWFFVVVFGLFGLLFGSFANVVIWRVPRSESVVSPGSHCPGCDTPIAWYDNIPVASWVALRGRCRACGEKIAVRYPIVEIASGVLFAAAALVFGPTLRGAVGAVFFWFLLVLTVIDLDCMRLPNPLVGTLAAIGAIGATVAQVARIDLVPLVGVAASGPLSNPLVAAAVGLILGGGLSGGVAVLYGIVRGRRGLGMGDVKLLGVLGIFLGPYVLLSLFIGSMLGAVAGLLAARGGRMADTKIPFGPWLAAGAVLTAFIGPPVVAWYLLAVGLS